MKKSTLIGHLKEYINNIPKSTVYNFQMKAYSNVIKKIQSLQTDDIDEKTIDDMDLTPYMKRKLGNMLKIKKQPKKSISSQLQEVAGIGRKLSQDLIKNGVKSLSDLKKKKYYNSLPLASQIDVKYKPIKPIPRYMIEYLETQMRKVKGPFIFVGSYRRKKAFSSDVDVLIQKEYIERIGYNLFIKYMKKPMVFIFINHTQWGRQKYLQLLD